MGLTDRLKRMIEGARKARESRDPESYARYERDRDYERDRADQQRHSQEDAAGRARKTEERTHDFEDRYALEHEQPAESDRKKRAEGPERHS